MKSLSKLFLIAVLVIATSCGKMCNDSNSKDETRVLNSSKVEKDSSINLKSNCSDEETSMIERHRRYKFATTGRPSYHF